MSKFDLSNQLISDTFGNLLQKTGSDNNLYDLKGNPIIDLTISGSLIAQSYIVSESTKVVTSGSTIFGNSNDDTHTFIGPVTASDGVWLSKGDTRVKLNGGSTDLLRIMDRNENVMAKFGAHSQILGMYGWGGDQVVAIDEDAWFAVGTNDYTTTNNPPQKLTVEGSVSASGVVYASDIVLGTEERAPDMTITVDGDISASGTIYGNNIESVRSNTTVFTTQEISGSTGFILGDIDTGAYVSASNGNLEISGSGTTGIEVDGYVSASGDLIVLGDITASGIISTSQDVIFGDDVFIEDDIFLTTLKEITWNSTNATSQLEETRIKGAAAGANSFISFLTGSATSFLFNVNSKTMGIGDDVALVPPQAITVSGSISASANLYIQESASIMTYTPATAGLTVDGNISASGHFFGNKNVYLKATNGIYFAYPNVAQHRIFYDAQGLEIQSSTSVGFPGSKVRINTDATSDAQLTVNGDVSSSGDYYKNNEIAPVVHVNLKSDDYTLANIYTQNDWYGAGYSGGQNLGSGIGTTVPITLLQATSYTAPSDMILHKMQVLIIPEHASGGSTTDLEFKVLKWTPVTGGTGVLTPTEISPVSSIDGTYTVDSTYAKEMTFNSGNTLSKGDGLIIAMRTTTSGHVKHQLKGVVTAELYKA